MVTQLPPDYFEFLNKVQQRLTKVIRSVGKIEHSQWRQMTNDRKTAPMTVRVKLDVFVNEIPVLSIRHLQAKKAHGIALYRVPLNYCCCLEAFFELEGLMFVMNAQMNAVQ